MPESKNESENLPVPVSKPENKNSGQEVDFNLEDKPLTDEQAYEQAKNPDGVKPDKNPSTEIPKAPKTLEEKIDNDPVSPIEPPKGCWYKIKKAGIYALALLAFTSFSYGSCTNFRDCRHAGNYLADSLVFSKQEQKVDNKKQIEPEAPVPAQGLTPSITPNYPGPVQGPVQPKPAQAQEKPKQEVKPKFVKTKDGYIIRHNNPAYKHELGTAVSCVDNGYEININKNLSNSKFIGLEAVLIDMNTLDVLEETKQEIKNNKAYISLANYSGNDNLRVGIIGYDNEGNKYILSSVGKSDKLTSPSICKTKQAEKKAPEKTVEPAIQEQDIKGEPVLAPEIEARKRQAEETKKPEYKAPTQKPTNKKVDISPFMIQYFDSNKNEFNLNDEESLYSEIRDNKDNRNEYMNANSIHYVKVLDPNVELEITSKFDKNGKPINFKPLKNKDAEGFYSFKIGKQADTLIRATTANGDRNFNLYLTSKTNDLAGDNVVLASGLSFVKLSASNSDINNFKKRHPQYNIKFLKADPHHAKELVTVVYHNSNGDMIGKDSIEYFVGQEVSKLKTINVNLEERSCESTEEYEGHSIKENRKVKCQWNCTGDEKTQNNNYVAPQNPSTKQIPQGPKTNPKPTQDNSTNPFIQEEVTKKKSPKQKDSSVKETPRIGISAAGLFINGTANINENNGSDNYKISGWETRLDGEAKFTENSSLVAQFTYGQQDESSENVKIRKKPFNVGGFYKGEFANLLEGTNIFAGYVYKENPLDIQVYDQKITQKVNTNEIVGYVDAQVVDVGPGTVGAYAGVVYDDTNINQKDEMNNENYNKKISQFKTLAGLSSEFDSGIKSSLGWEQYTENVDYTNNKILTGNNLTGTFEWETSKNILRAYGSYPISGPLQKMTIGLDDSFSVLPNWYLKILANWEKYNWNLSTTNTNYNKENFEIGAAVVYGIPDIKPIQIERLLH
ncbi:MAG: hypothetical protein WC413_00940 [Candidatus Nanoarchaeia archaeon]